MKKFIAAVALSLTVSASFAQSSISKGTIAVGGSLNFGSTSTETPVTGGTNESKSSSFSFMPQGSYFIMDNLSVGLGIGFTSGSTETTPAGGSTTETSSSSLSIMPMVRYYMMQNDMFGWYTQFDFAYNTGSSEVKPPVGPSTTTDNSGTAINLRPGLVFFPHKNVGIETTFGSLGYSSTKTKPASGNETTTTNFGLKYDYTAFTFGFQYYLGR